MDKNRIIALTVTCIIALLLMVLMMVVHISAGALDREWPPRHDGEVAFAEDEQYFEVMQEARVNVSSNQLAAPAHNPEPAKNQSDPAPPPATMSPTAVPPALPLPPPLPPALRP